MSGGNILQQIQEGAEFVFQNCKEIKVNTDALDEFVISLHKESFQRKKAPLSFPLKWESTAQEVNFIAILNLLNFGSGFRKPLHHYTERGAYETICYGLIGMQISRTGSIDAEFMTQLSIQDIETFFGIPVSKEKQIQPGISMYVPTELKDFAELLKRVLSDTGRILRARMLNDFSDFIYSSLDTQNPKAANLVEKLMMAFPSLNDRGQFQGREIVIGKKAQILVAELYKKFKDLDPRFNFVDIDQLTIFADTVIPAVLRKLNIIQLDDALAEKIDTGKHLPAGGLELELRAVSISVCQAIVKKVKEKYNLDDFNAMELDYYLWTLGKEPQFRIVERHSTIDTVFY